MDVTELEQDDLEKLTSEQMQFVANLHTRAINPGITKMVKEALEGKEEEIIAAFTVAPYAYVGPEMEINKGFKVRLRSLYEDQTRDVQASARKFAMAESPSEMMAAVYFNKCFLSHSLEEVNGEPFAGVTLPPAYVNVAFEDPERAQELLSTMRDKRMRTLGAYPQIMVNRLSDAHQVFQRTIDSVIKGEDMAEILGN
jgi:hypothetical protein